MKWSVSFAFLIMMPSHLPDHLGHMCWQTFPWWNVGFDRNESFKQRFFNNFHVSNFNERSNKCSPKNCSTNSGKKMCSRKCVLPTGWNNCTTPVVPVKSNFKPQPSWNTVFKVIVFAQLREMDSAGLYFGTLNVFLRIAFLMHLSEEMPKIVLHQVVQLSKNVHR